MEPDSYPERTTRIVHGFKEPQKLPILGDVYVTAGLPFALHRPGPALLAASRASRVARQEGRRPCADNQEGITKWQQRCDTVTRHPRNGAPFAILLRTLGTALQVPPGFLSRTRRRVPLLPGSSKRVTAKSPLHSDTE